MCIFYLFVFEVVFALKFEKFVRKKLAFVFKKCSLLDKSIFFINKSNLEIPSSNRHKNNYFVILDKLILTYPL
jgi:hypothetical protein